MRSAHPKKPRQHIFILHEPRTGMEWYPLSNQKDAEQEVKDELGYSGRKLVVLHYKLMSVTED